MLLVYVLTPLCSQTGRCFSSIVWGIWLGKVSYRRTGHFQTGHHWWRLLTCPGVQMKAQSFLHAYTSVLWLVSMGWNQQYLLENSTVTVGRKVYHSQVSFCWTFELSGWEREWSLKLRPSEAKSHFWWMSFEQRSCAIRSSKLHLMSLASHCFV